MTLSASAIINGLTMLRAYGLGLVTSDSSGILVVVPEGTKFHPEDERRMMSEGWESQVDQNGVRYWALASKELG